MSLAQSLQIAREIENSLDISPIFLGLIMCFKVPAIARKTQMTDTATYDHPRKGCLPPIQETVEMTMDFVPSNMRTG